jgi:anhydro-N-acetylmuramic acid kinase
MLVSVMDAPTPMDYDRWIVGCMTGTSLDGLDAVLVRVVGRGLELEARFVGTESRPLGVLAGVLGDMAKGQPHEPIAYMRAARQLGQLHAHTVGELCRKHLPDGEALDFVVAHGQTIWHAPDDHLSWQLFDPQPLVRQLGVAVCYDLRQADLIAGGRGAPITPVADQLMYRNQPDAIINLGGVCNITHLGAVADGFDLCPCNLLIDRVVRYYYPDLSYDQDGALAAAGNADPAIFQALFAALPLGQDKRESLGRENLTDQAIADLVEPWRDRCTAEDVIASAVEAVAKTVASAVQRLGVSKVILAGGGARNSTLVGLIGHHCRGLAAVSLSDDVGIPCEAREAMGFAVLGALCQDRVVITLEQVTGSAKPGCAGVWAYP